MLMKSLIEIEGLAERLPERIWSLKLIILACEIYVPNSSSCVKDLFIGPQEFVVGYSKAPEQPQSSARPMC